MVPMNKIDLEIAISTMNRTDLSFLEKMFPENDLSEFNILIINQTVPDKILMAEQAHIRVINSFERGLSKSRNLALEKAKGEILLIADDDIQYLPGFSKTVKTAFQRNKTAALLSFQFLAIGDTLQKNYIHTERKITHLQGEPDLSSWEIALQPVLLRKHQVWFNTDFGLGAAFPSGEETLLLNEVLKKKLPAYHIPEIIGRHEEFSTGTAMNNENHIRGNAALKYLKYGKKAKLSLLYYLYLSVKKKRLSLSKVSWAYRTGVSAIKTCESIYKRKENPFQ